jgi:beta-N-acetylhexosaminidase
MRMVLQVGVGGVIHFARNYESPTQIAELNGELIGQTRDRVPLLISVDQEGGPVARFRSGFTEIPAMGVLGALDDLELTRRVAAMVARELRAVGVNLNYAPVVDVNTNPQNPVIGIRAFGADVERVSRHATTVIAALQEAGVAACAKHFPGHGDTITDSHEALPVVDHGRERVERVELEPFRAAIAAGVATLMTAHVMYPAYDESLPATLSPRLLQGVLREDLGFESVCITDDLEMKAITRGWGIPEAACRSIAAGADMILVCHQEAEQMGAMEAIARGLRDGDVPEGAFMAGQRRIDALKKRFCPPERYRVPDVGGLEAVLRCEAHQALVAEVSDRAEPLQLAVTETGGGATTSGDA